MADSTEKRADGTTTETGGDQKSGKSAFFVILGGIVLLNAVVAYFLVTATMKQVTPEAEAEAVDTATVTRGVSEATGTYADSTLEAIVNIAGTDGLRFLKVVMVMEFDGKAYQNLRTELNRRHVVLKNLLIDMLSGMSLEELQSESARNTIRQRFLSKANMMLPEREAGKLSNVYLTEFIIQ